jgi:hypothetical protein
MGYTNYAASTVVKVMPAKEVQVTTDVDGDILNTNIAPITTFSEVYSEGVQLAAPILVYGGTAKPITLRDVVNGVIAKTARSLSNCYISEKDWLIITVDALKDMVGLTGDKKFNNFIAETTIKLELGRTDYPLPSNFDKEIALWAENDVLWNSGENHYNNSHTTKKKFDFVPRTSWSQNNRIYTYTRMGKKILIKAPRERERTYCNNCRHCDACDLVKGTLRLEYYFVPDFPTSLDEELWWFWDHFSAEQYLEESVIESVYMINKQSYNSPTKAEYRNKLLEFDNNLNPVDASPKINKRTFMVGRY